MLLHPGMCSVDAEIELCRPQARCVRADLRVADTEQRAVGTSRPRQPDRRLRASLLREAPRDEHVQYGGPSLGATFAPVAPGVDLEAREGRGGVADVEV